MRKEWSIFKSRRFVKDCMDGKLKFLDGILEAYKQTTGHKLPDKELKEMAKNAKGSSNDLIRAIQKRIMDHEK